MKITTIANKNENPTVPFLASFDGTTVLMIAYDSVTRIGQGCPIFPKEKLVIGEVRTCRIGWDAYQILPPGTQVIFTQE